MYLHLGQPSEFNSAQLPSFLHCPPFFGLLESKNTQSPEQNLCGLLLSWCWWSPMMWKRWWTRNRKGMIDASNGCNDDKAQSRLLESEPLPLINNDTITGSVRERKTDFWYSERSIIFRYDDVDVVGADITSMNWSCNHWFVLVLIFWQRSVRKQSNSFEKKCKKDHFVFCLFVC